MDSHLSTKTGSNSLNGFWENAFYGRTDAHDTALALLTQSTRAKNIQKIIFFFQNSKKCLGIWPRESKNQHLKEIHAIGSDIIDATDGRTTDDERRTNFDFMSSVKKIILVDRQNIPLSQQCFFFLLLLFLFLLLLMMMVMMMMMIIIIRSMCGDQQRKSFFRLDV